MFFIKTYRLSLFIFLISISFFSFSQKDTVVNKLDQLFVKWSNSNYQNPNNVLHLACQPIDTVRIAVIGLGNRGQMALERLPKIEGVKIIAIADIDSYIVNESADKFLDLIKNILCQYSKNLILIKWSLLYFLHTILRFSKCHYQYLF